VTGLFLSVWRINVNLQLQGKSRPSR